jgi:hypothetical protein
MIAGVTGLFLWGACRSQENPEKQKRQVPPQPTRVASSSGAVLPISAGKRLLNQCSRRTAWGIREFWRPDDAAIAILEEKLPMFVDSVGGRSWNSLREAVSRDAYLRQYIGTVRWNGERTIYVNAFHRRHLEALNDARAQIARQQGRSVSDTVAWRLVPLVVCDGGEAFFGIEYDPQTGRFRNLRVNARADGSG